MRAVWEIFGSAAARDVPRGGAYQTTAADAAGRRVRGIAPGKTVTS